MRSFGSWFFLNSCGLHNELYKVKKNMQIIQIFWQNIQKSYLGMFEGCVALSAKGHSQSKVLSSGKFFFHGGSVMVKRLPFTWVPVPIKSCSLYVHVKVGSHLLNYPTEKNNRKIIDQEFLGLLWNGSKGHKTKLVPWLKWMETFSSWRCRHERIFLFHSLESWYQ